MLEYSSVATPGSPKIASSVLNTEGELYPSPTTRIRDIGPGPGGRDVTCRKEVSAVGNG
jgi:hypothetical protein